VTKSREISRIVANCFQGPDQGKRIHPPKGVQPFPWEVIQNPVTIAAPEPEWLHAPRNTRPCLWCREPIPVDSRADYCSRACQVAAWRAADREAKGRPVRLAPASLAVANPLECRGCGGPILATTRPDAAWCSARCRQASYRARRQTSFLATGR
jgi:hypothetical protein